MNAVNKHFSLPFLFTFMLALSLTSDSRAMEDETAQNKAAHKHMTAVEDRIQHCMDNYSSLDSESQQQTIAQCKAYLNSIAPYRTACLKNKIDQLKKLTFPVYNTLKRVLIVEASILSLWGLTKYFSLPSYSSDFCAIGAIGYAFIEGMYCVASHRTRNDRLSSSREKLQAKNALTKKWAQWAKQERITIKPLSFALPTNTECL